MSRQGDVYGLLAEFDDGDRLKEAAIQARIEGYRNAEAYAPFELEGLPESLGMRWSSVPLIMLIAGIIGGVAGYFMQYYATVIEYPHNIGGRPLNAWPMYIPITFEMTVLSAAVAGVIAFFVLNGLPRLHHPLFNDPGFDRASDDRFFLCLRADEKRFDHPRTKRFLERLGPLDVREVRW